MNARSRFIAVCLGLAVICVAVSSCVALQRLESATGELGTVTGALAAIPGPVQPYAVLATVILTSLGTVLGSLRGKVKGQEQARAEASEAVKAVSSVLDDAKFMADGELKTAAKLIIKEIDRRKHVSADTRLKAAFDLYEVLRKS